MATLVQLWERVSAVVVESRVGDVMPILPGNFFGMSPISRAIGEDRGCDLICCSVAGKIELFKLSMLEWASSSSYTKSANLNWEHIG